MWKYEKSFRQHYFSVTQECKMFLSSISSKVFLESGFKSAKQRHFHRLFYSLNNWGFFLVVEFHYSCKAFCSPSVISPLFCLQPVLIHRFSMCILCLWLDLIFLGWKGRALEITIQLSFLSSFFSLLHFLGNKGPDSPGSPNIILYLSQTLTRLASGQFHNHQEKKQS